MKSIRFALEYALLRSLLLLLALPPRRLALAGGRMFGRCIHALGVRRSVVLSNLAIAFPERTPEERETLARRVYEHFGAVIVDTANFHRWSEADLRERSVLRGWEHFAAALATGRGVLLATAHLGCFDVGPGRIAIEGPRVTSIFQGVRNPYVERYITRLRTRGGQKVAKRGIQFREVLRALKAGECVTILADQDAGPQGLFIPFFTRDASTLTGAAEFAKRTGAILMTGFVPLVNGRYELTFEAPIPDGTVDAMMREYNRRVERIVVAHPDQYFWLHKRWRSEKPATSNER